MRWHQKENRRAMPWKGEKDPYKIWLSEIILQQTRVEQGLDYYNRFVSAFPSIHALANAPEKQVLKLWEGLGYYTRCRNLIATAQFISEEKKGRFPSAYEDILALKGVGPYTAAAIASFAFSLPYAVIDGNVLRVLSRYFGISAPIDSTEGKKIYGLLANELLDTTQPGMYNQAIMDFGATICKPQQPQCGVCPQRHQCQALQLDKVNELPVKEKQLVKKTRFFHYFIIRYKEKTIVRQRTAKDIWQGLHEFPLLEAEQLLGNDDKRISGFAETVTGTKKFSIIGISAAQRQQLTHQLITGRFIEIHSATAPRLSDGYQLATAQELAQLAFPKFITGWLQQKGHAPQLF